MTTVLVFNMIREEGKLEAKANLGKRLVDITSPDDFVAELALLCDIRSLEVGNKVRGRTPPARKCVYCKVRTLHRHLHSHTCAEL